MVSALSLSCVTNVCAMFCVCVVFTISVFIKFHISCRLQTYQLLKHANYYNKLLISSLMINDSNNGWQMTNSKIKSDSLKLVSLNVRGLSNFRKCGAIFTWCRKQKADLIFLQETHSTKAGGYKWKKRMGFRDHFLSWELECQGCCCIN